jgi:hypothetical protein
VSDPFRVALNNPKFATRDLRIGSNATPPSVGAGLGFRMTETRPDQLPSAQSCSLPITPSVSDWRSR